MSNRINHTWPTEAPASNRKMAAVVVCEHAIQQPVGGRDTT
jgi:hypothetical protein